MVLQEKRRPFLKVIQKKMKLATYWYSISFALTSLSCNQEFFQIDDFGRKRCTTGTCLKETFSSSIFWTILDLSPLSVSKYWNPDSCLPSFRSQLPLIYGGRGWRRQFSPGVSLQSSLWSYIFFQLLLEVSSRIPHQTGKIYKICFMVRMEPFWKGIPK